MKIPDYFKVGLSVKQFPACIILSLVATGCALVSNEKKVQLPQQGCSFNLTEGYTDKVSYSAGETMKVFLHGSKPLELCRLTVRTINGDSAFSVAATLPFHYPYPWFKGATEGFDYKVCAQVKIPNIQSGVYLIENLIPFIIKSSEPVDITVVYPSNTATAYCESGGKSLYSRSNRPYQVSFQRPTALQPYSKYCLEWLPSLSKNTSIGYIADVDLDDYTNISSSRIISIIGHSEYWTFEARNNFDRFVDNGGHAIILSGNVMWWQVRYSEDKTKLICYKSDANKDPVKNLQLVTTNWNDPSLNYPIISSIGADFENGGYGLEKDNGWDGFKIVTPSSPLLEGTGVKKGDVLSLPSLECDGTPLAGYDNEGYPIADNNKVTAHKLEIVAFDRTFRYGETAATFIVMQKAPSSGFIVNTATTGWCSETGMGGKSGEHIKQITFNAVDKLLKGKSVFSSDM